MYNYAHMSFGVTILGASGYAGGELLRLLANHPAMAVVGLGAERAAGGLPAAVHPHLASSELPAMSPLIDAAAVEADVCFSALPSGVLTTLLPGISARIVVDLADDHRGSPGWVYGLVETKREEVRGANRVANPGCYPTAALLSLMPFVGAGSVDGPVIVDALSGVSGAGKRTDDSYLFASQHGSATAYGTTHHRHVPEMERELSRQAGKQMGVSFTPHLVPMARGLLATCRTRWIGDGDPADVLRDAYAKERFVYVSDGWPSTKAVAGTNRAAIHAELDVRNDYLVVSCAIDNLGKGAAGQAIQNANVALDLDEALGLDHVAVWP